MLPAVYATGDIAARTDQPYSDQSSSRNPLDRISATNISRSNRLIGDLTSLDSVDNGKKNLTDEGYRGNPRKKILHVGKMMTIALPMKRTMKEPINRIDAGRSY